MRFTRSRRAPVGALRAAACVAVAVAVAVAVTGPAAAAASPPSRSPGGSATLRAYAADTWRSMTAMTDPATGLPADKITGDLKTAATMTSPTNIGAYLWSTLVARDLGFISARDAAKRVGRTLGSVGRLERHAPDGQFYNWYDPKTLKLVTVWPEDGSTVKPFLSSVDNGWLATALMMVRTAVPQEKARAERLLAGMDFRAYYDPVAATNGTGLLRGGFWPQDPAPTCSIKADYLGTGTEVSQTCHTYGSPGETRIASYVGIARGQLPPQHYFGLLRTLGDDGCSFGWQEQRPPGTFQTHLGIRTYEGTYGYRGMRLVPIWGGSMFEELMPDLFVPERSWAARSWGRNHPVFVAAQIEHGLREAKYGYWGFSPSNDPYGGYRAYGVDAIGMQSDGYPSDEEGTLVDYGYEGCREAAPEPASYGDGIVTPHASFLALPYASRAALGNLAGLRRDFDAYGPGGFYDAIAVRSGKVSKFYLALDQGMIMAALGNELAHGNMRRYFAAGEAEHRLRPVLGLEEWDVVPPSPAARARLGLE
ncbi:glucoamylase family protein [Actinomadura sp. HBU206391]|uniref:glucoamylase family protein n=1 Tax=Actinomadura sp. HBU206391 TaxID=2731692 RepID=UPI00164F5056|nr:glucoamylase family protein [Actinomadura sp. HBU206391]MBC6460141.1 DUF3131 domain-containing protein [Actinomadura sp. HBU206391]